jgi:nicotinate-nucleotide adenylyltransferase
MTRIGIFGGTFSPPHNGHIAAARAFMEQMWLDILYVIPTGVPPHKESDTLVSAQHRLEMCRLAFSGVDGVIVSDLELRREGKSYTVDTLRQMYHPDNRLFFLMGTDMLMTLDRWREPEEIFRLCYPVYVRRETDTSLDDAIIQRIAEYNVKYGKVVRRIVTPAIEVSSTLVRDTVAAGGDVSGMVPASVAAYIYEKGLYK